MTHLARDQWTFPDLNELGLQEFQALIINYKRKTVLLKRYEAWWIMPAYVGDDHNYESSFLPEFVKDKIRQEVGIPMDLWVLRQVWRKEMEVVKNNVHSFPGKAVVLVAFFGDEKEDSRAKDNQNGYEWVSLEKAEIYHLFSDAKSMVAQEMKWVMQAKVPPKRLKWQRPRWIEGKTSWMEEVLFRERGARILKPIEAERSTHLGTILEAETTKGKFFLKCTTPWQNDAAYTEVLSRIAPKYVAPPVTVDVEEQVMITSDYGKILIPVVFDKENEKKLTRDFVKLQQEAVGNIDELVRAGFSIGRAQNTYGLGSEPSFAGRHRGVQGICRGSGILSE